MALSDEELLAEGLVYDGVIDYYVIDDEGSTFSSSGEVEELSENETDVIIESFEEYNSSVQSTQDTASIAGTYYGSEVKFDDLPRLGLELYGEIPDCGLAMFGQFYYMDSIHKYCCAVSSAVGCLNWLGILDNGSVTDTYNNIWNRCVSSESIEYDNALNAYTGGASDYNLSRALSAYLSEKGVETKAIYKERPTFNDYIDSINSYNDKESCPATVGIGGYKTEDDKEKYEGHSVIAMSYYCTTYPGQSIYTDYLGIYRNWGAWNGSLENAGENIRYLNYSSLMSESGVIVTGVFFQNVSSRNIKQVRTSNVTALGYNISCIVPYGTTFVFFPTWSMNNGSDDVEWHMGIVTNGTTGSIHVNTADHNNDSGRTIVNMQ